MDKVEITLMNMSDLEMIKDVLLSDFDDFWNYSTLKSELQNPNSKYIVAKLDDTIVGFAGIWKSVDDIHITNIVVNKNFRNQKIGSLLLNKLIEIANSEPNISSITLEVNSNNTPAIKLYENFGFKIAGLRKKYYNNADDAIIYTKCLN